MTVYDLARKQYEFMRKHIHETELWPAWEKTGPNARRPWIAAARDVIDYLEEKNDGQQKIR